MNEISRLEVDLLFLFYVYSNQFGDVDIPVVKQIAQQKLGVLINWDPFQVTQEHVEVLIHHKIIPDISDLFSRLGCSINKT
jgi:hypothetical protein